MAIDTTNMLARGRIPAFAISTTRVFPIDLVTAEPIPGLARRSTRPLPPTEAAEQAVAMNAVLVALNALLTEGGAHA